MIIKYTDLVSTTSEFHRMTNIEHNGVYVQVSTVGHCKNRDNQYIKTPYYAWFETMAWICDSNFDRRFILDKFTGHIDEFGAFDVSNEQHDFVRKEIADLMESGYRFKLGVDYYDNHEVF